MRIAVVSMSDGSDVRYSKLCRSLSALGHTVHFIGWNRTPGIKKDINLGECRKHVMVSASSFGKANILKRLRFNKHARKIVNQIKPDLVHVGNEDATYGVVRRRFKCRPVIVCDIRDALVDRHSDKPWLVRLALKWVSYISRNAADLLIVTDENRWKRLGEYSRKAIVVHNYPEDPGAELSSQIPTGPLRIYVGGALGKNRGIESFLNAIEGMNDVVVESAGWIRDDIATAFVRHPKVQYHGIVSGQHSLQLAASCDAILCQYAPVTINNIHASPNKVYDAISVGRKILVNREVSMLPWIEKHRTGLINTYGDVQSLREQLESLRLWRDGAQQEARRLRNLFEEGYSWDICAEKIHKCYLDLTR